MTSTQKLVQNKTLLQEVVGVIVWAAAINVEVCGVCQDLVSYYFYFVLLPLGPELW